MRAQKLKTALQIKVRAALSTSKVTVPRSHAHHTVNASVENPHRRAGTIYFSDNAALDSLPLKNYSLSIFPDFSKCASRVWSSNNQEIACKVEKWGLNTETQRIRFELIKLNGQLC